MSFLTRNRAWGLAIAAVVFVLDQYVKYLVDGPLGLKAPGDHLGLLPFFDFTRTHNYGVSLGMFTATSAEMRWGLVAVTAAIALVVVVWMMRERKFGDTAALGLILGGALGNIIDRISYGYVLDYADFHIGEIRPFLIFNIADAAISVGVVIILARSLFLREKRPDESETAAERPQATQSLEPASAEKAAETN